MPNTKYIQKRISAIQQKVASSKTDWYLVSGVANMKYLSGMHTLSPLHREMFILIGTDQIYFIHSPLIAVPNYVQSMGIVEKLSPQNSLSNLLKKIVGRSELMGDFNDLKMEEATNIEKNTKLKIVTSNKIIESTREIKDDDELESIKKACQITAETWDELQETIQVGITEKDLQRAILAKLQEKGADAMSEEFLPIVAFGEHSSVPHHQSSDRILAKNEVVLVDFGCQVAGYWSDMTRTIKIGKSDRKEFCNIESIVKTAYHKAITTLTSTHDPAKADEAVDMYLQNQGYGGLMPHTTGHGIGLEVHEHPTLSRLALGQRLENKMVFTIEPGLYMSNEFGYRYENTLQMSNGNISVLTETKT